MNKLYIIIVALVLFLVWDKTLNNKEVATVQSQTTTNTSSLKTEKKNIIKTVNSTLLFGNCNTPISRTARSCDVMYASYKEKYKLIKGYSSIFQDKSKPCTKNGIKQAKELAHELAEEECDYKVLDFVIDNSLGLACDHIYTQKRNFMFKNEYCNKYIK